MAETFLSACRACGHSELTPAFSVGTDNAWVFCGDASGESGCGLIQRAMIGGTHKTQLPAPMSWTEQYRLRSVVTSALEMVSTREGRALDIGCGHGSLLSAYPRWITPVGVDERLEQSGAHDWGIGLAADFLNPDTVETLAEMSDGGYDVITAVGSLERSHDPTSFLHQIRSLLASDGVAVVETTYAALALMRTMASAFHRDAEAVYSLENIEQLAASVGLRIIRGSMTEANGGSIRLFMSHADYHGHDYAPWFETLARMWDEEASLSLRGRAAYAAFHMRMAAREMDVAAFKANMLRAQEYAYVLGTGSRIMASLRGGDLDYDVISAHVGPEYRGGFPEIITEEHARENPPDVLIAPAWRRRESLEAWHDEVMAGMRIVFVEPELLIVDSDNYGAELGRALAVTDGPGSVETLRAALTAMRGTGLRVVAQQTESADAM